jgi:hypothetical protein
MINFYTGQTVISPRDHRSHVRLVTKKAVLPDCGIGPTAVGQQCYGYLIEYAANTYPPGSGHYSDSWGWSTLPASYPQIPRCTDPALGPQVKPCMHKFIWNKVAAPNTSPYVLNPVAYPEVFPPN